MRLLLAPDSFKGTLTATEVADALAAGAARAGAGADACPLGDGGEGTLEVLLGALGGERISVAAHDALGREIEASIGLTGDGLAIVETAAAIGLSRIDRAELDAEAATSAGAGELIGAAASRASVVLVCLGGSATTDGGTGAARAIEAMGGTSEA